MVNSLFELWSAESHFQDLLRFNSNWNHCHWYQCYCSYCSCLGRRMASSAWLALPDSWAREYSPSSPYNHAATVPSSNCTDWPTTVKTASPPWAYCRFLACSNSPFWGMCPPSSSGYSLCHSVCRGCLGFRGQRRSMPTHSLFPWYQWHRRRCRASSRWCFGLVDYSWGSRQGLSWSTSTSDLVSGSWRSYPHL